MLKTGQQRGPFIFDEGTCPRALRLSARWVLMPCRVPRIEGTDWLRVSRHTAVLLQLIALDMRGCTRFGLSLKFDCSYFADYFDLDLIGREEGKGLGALGRMVLRGLAAGDLVYGLCCPLPVKLQTPQGTV